MEATFLNALLVALSAIGMRPLWRWAIERARGRPLTLVNDSPPGRPSTSSSKP
jgi:hypothetical protein